VVLNIGGAGSPATQPMLSFTSASGKRAYPRLDLPIIIEIGGSRYQARDWSVGGFALREGGPKAAIGDIFKVTLHFAFTGFDAALDVVARVAWTAADAAAGFQFVTLTEEKARILDYVCDAWLRGEFGTFDKLIEHRPAVLNLSAQAGKRRQRLVPTLRAVLFVLAGFVALGGGGFYLVSMLLTVRSDYAAVASALTQIRAPESGYMIASPFKVGSHVDRGTVVASIMPAVSPQTVMWYDTQISVLETQRGELRASLGYAQAGFGNFSHAAKAELQSATSARSLLESQVTVEERIFAEMEALAKDGVLARAAVDQEQVKLIALRGQVATARAAEALARQHANDSEKGLFPSDGRSTQKSPADIEHLIAETEAQIAQLRDSKAATEKPLSVTSPCDCTVMEIEANANEFVAMGNPIVSLAERNRSATEIDALVLSSRLDLVQTGEAVNVYLSGHREAVPGRVVGINYDPANSGRAGLPDVLRTLNNYGLATIAIDNDAAGVSEPTGLPAIVNFPVDPGILVRNYSGIAWFVKSPPPARFAARTGGAAETAEATKP
jgi:multidrug resistance efflux pump